jgi:hypothetical protein
MLLTTKKNEIFDYLGIFFRMKIPLKIVIWIQIILK